MQLNNLKNMNNMTKTVALSILTVLVVLAVGIGLFKLSENAVPFVPVKDPNELVGKPMPHMNLTDKEDKSFDWDSIKNKKTVLFFNEGLMCYPACWDQMAAFGKDERYNSATAAAVSVITDMPSEWDTAIKKMPDLAKAITMFDSEAKNSKLLGLLSVASSMHMGRSLGHTYVLIDQSGIVREVIDDPNMAVNNDKIWEKLNQY